jgi:hypothetical protein
VSQLRRTTIGVTCLPSVWPLEFFLEVHKSRLGARPPRKRSAPVAGKWTRTDETPLQAGFRVLGLRTWVSRWTSRDRAA